MTARHALVGERQRTTCGAATGHERDGLACADLVVADGPLRDGTLPRPPYEGHHRAENRMHLGWGPAPADCTCRKAPCGYVDDRIDPACPFHHVGDTTKLHRASSCRGATERPPSPTYSFTLVEQPGGGSDG